MYIINYIVKFKVLGHRLLPLDVLYSSYSTLRYSNIDTSLV